jgi:hypothetical protein
VSWFARIRSIAVLGAVVTTGLVAGAFLSVSSAKERKAKASPPVAKDHPDGGGVEPKNEADKKPAKHKKAEPNAERVRRAQPIPRDYVE